ncbi:MAG: hydrogenase maturation protease [Calothrix sp. SM1_5_4]|nr:hydrogenase maturation protease [Calothrix sp. SM1_5_4]
MDQRFRVEPGERVLIYGIGNVGRQDDGLGVRLVESLEADGGLGAGIAYETGYQLNIEDALLLSEFDVVLFVDAAVSGHAREPFQVERLEPSAGVEFSTHAMRPESVLSLCEELYQRRPRAYMLALPGYEWDIQDQLSEPAARNMRRALTQMIEEIRCMRSRSSQV